MRLALLLLLLCLIPSCGYRMLAEKGIYGGDIVSIELPLFGNATKEPHISSYVTEEFSSELLSSGLFEIKEKSPAIIRGEIIGLRIYHEAFGKGGFVTEKRLELSVTLSLYNKGELVRKWDLRESETYLVSEKNLEEYMKREAIKRVSKRMARNFVSLLLKEY